MLFKNNVLAFVDKKVLSPSSSDNFAHIKIKMVSLVSLNISHTGSEYHFTPTENAFNHVDTFGMNIVDKYERS